MDEDDIAGVFIEIKPLVEEVVARPTKANVDLLNHKLAVVDGNGLQILQSLILQQLIFVLESLECGNRNELATHLLHGFEIVLQRVRTTKLVAIKTMLVVALKQIYVPSTGEIKPGLSEEFKLVVLRVISLTVRRMDTNMVEELYVKENLKLLSQVVFVSVTIATTEHYRKLRYQAVDTILSLLHIHDDVEFGDIVLRCQVAELLFVILPKLLLTLITLINGDEKQGVAVFNIAIKALGRVLGLIFEDYAKEGQDEYFDMKAFASLVQKAQKTSQGLDQNILGMGLKEERQKEVYFAFATRTREWMLEAEKRVEQTLRQIVHLSGHEDDTIRLTYANMCCDLLQRCQYNMPTCTVHYFESVLALSLDSSNKIRNMCVSSINLQSKDTLFLAGHRTDDLFFKAVERTPRAILRGSESEQIAAFSMLHGYFSFFSDSQLCMIFSNPEITSSFVTALLTGAELESADRLVKREYLYHSFEYDEQQFRVEKESQESKWITLKYISTERARQSFTEMIQSLSAHPQGLTSILSYILEDFFSSKMNSNGYLFLLSELIPTSCNNRSFDDSLRSILDEVLQPYHWNLELDDNDSLADQMYNVLHVCLIMRLLGRSAAILKGEFRFYLYDSLKHMLQVSAKSLVYITNSSEVALNAIAKHMGHANIQLLIHEHLDYISQYITRCIRRKDSFQAGIHTLESVLRYVPYESSVTLDLNVGPIVMNILDSYSQYEESNATVCLRALQIFMQALRRRYETDPIQAKPSGMVDGKVPTTLADKITHLQQLLQQDPSDFVTEEFAPTEFNEVPLEPEEFAAACEADMPPEPTKESLPFHITVALRILSVNFKYLSAAKDTERMIALQTLNEGIYVLRSYENDLLPLVHNIWFNLAERFADPSPVVVNYAFEMLMTLAKLSKDFIRKRTLDDVLPKLMKFMQDNVAADLGALQVYKLQKNVLQHLPDLVLELKLSERQLNQLLGMVKLYLAKSERQELRKCAEDCLRNVRKFDPTAVLLKHSWRC